MGFAEATIAILHLIRSASFNKKPQSNFKAEQQGLQSPHDGQSAGYRDDVGAVVEWLLGVGICLGSYVAGALQFVLPRISVMSGVDFVDICNLAAGLQVAALWTVDSIRNTLKHMV